MLDINAPTPPFLLLHSGQGLPDARADITRKFTGALRRNGTDIGFFDGTAYSHREMNRLIGAKTQSHRP